MHTSTHLGFKLLWHIFSSLVNPRRWPVQVLSSEHVLSIQSVLHARCCFGVSWGAPHAISILLRIAQKDSWCIDHFLHICLDEEFSSRFFAFICTYVTNWVQRQGTSCLLFASIPRVSLQYVIRNDESSSYLLEATLPGPPPNVWRSIELIYRMFQLRELHVLLHRARGRKTVG